MRSYCNPDWQPLLENQQLSTFEQIWDAPLVWLDAPNRNRGGWSGVGCMQFERHGQSVTVYVKKQQNHTSRSLLHPVAGEPTFAKEFRWIRHLSQHGITVPELIFFAQRKNAMGQQAILMTQDLEGFCSLDQINRHALTVVQQRILIACVAKTLRKMHDAGVQHRALYSKHIFVKSQAQGFAVGLIDFEKSRKMLLPRLQAISDLITLNYRTVNWGISQRLCFFKEYYALVHLNRIYKILVRWIARKTIKKQYQ